MNTTKKIFVVLLSIIGVCFPLSLIASEPLLKTETVDSATNSSTFLVNLSNNKDAKEAPDKLVEKYFEDTRDIKILDLSENQWDSQQFNSFTESIRKKGTTFPKLRYLVLATNYINQDATDSLLYWLNFPKIEFINLTSTPLSLKNINVLYKSLSEKIHDEKELLKLMGKILFIDPGYLKVASTKVNIYKRFVDENHIPQDWANRHHDFYTSKLFNNYKSRKQQLSNIASFKSVFRNKNLSDKEIAALVASMEQLDISTFF